ncbi:hypothetical protein PGT21_016075 [Puccinia graminis f. sp. tritici]|uniref:Uncharacterized protein n=1 Tax=Puccinia graminis f. sp. tritici TaxID=56615 RepID=A0A5B0ND80_PUCGR|nr:hypothetical protein PGT21_016075 [Puccinia graminis f. sp. tritici]
MYFCKIAFQTKQAQLSEAKMVASTPAVHSLITSEWIDDHSNQPKRDCLPQH